MTNIGNTLANRLPNRPCRVRVLDLPFAAVEWLLPTLPLGGEPEALQLATLGWQRSVDQAGCVDCAVLTVFCQ